MTLQAVSETLEQVTEALKAMAAVADINLDGERPVLIVKPVMGGNGHALKPPTPPAPPASPMGALHWTKRPENAWRIKAATEKGRQTRLAKATGAPARR